MCIHLRPLMKGAFFIITIHRRIWTLVLSFIILATTTLSASASVLGPTLSYEELRSLIAGASEGDTILVSGEIHAQNQSPLCADTFVHLRADGSSTISGLSIANSSLSVSGITLTDTLSITGTSHIQLGKGVSISGASGSVGLSFHGNGALIIERGCTIEGGSCSTGASISHSNGEFYASIEGSILGGSGVSGGTGLVISPLRDNGAVMITGSIEGGKGDTTGGHALNLYDLRGNAYITVDGRLEGGSGSIGGDGIQLVSASDNVSVGISGTIKGGSGKNYGGDALILMNAQDASSFHISGHFAGGDGISENAQPGTSIQLVGNAAATRARIDNCILEDGKSFRATPAPAVTATPDPTMEPEVEPTPTAEPTLNPVPEATATPDAVPTTVPITEPSVAPSTSPSEEVANESETASSDMPAAEPTPDILETQPADQI